MKFQSFQDTFKTVTGEICPLESVDYVEKLELSEGCVRHIQEEWYFTSGGMTYDSSEVLWLSPSPPLSEFVRSQAVFPPKFAIHPVFSGSSLSCYFFRLKMAD